MQKFLIFDTETVGIYDRRIYDIAWQIVDRYGNLYSRYNFIVKEVYNNGGLMAGAYYQKKVPEFYVPAVKSGAIPVMPWAQIIEIFRTDLMVNGVDTIAAYNIKFDIEAMRTTQAWYGEDEKTVTDGEYRSLCLWQFVVDAILSRNKFQKIATELGWFKTSTGNVYTNAEKAFAYISGEWGFVEDHTAMSDVEIETYIFAAAMRQKKKIPYGVIGGSPWKLAQ